MTLAGNRDDITRTISRVIAFAEASNVYPETVLYWLHAARPCVVTDAALQKIYGVVSACIHTMAETRSGLVSGFDYGDRLRRIRRLCLHAPGNEHYAQ